MAPPSCSHRQYSTSSFAPPHSRTSNRFALGHHLFKHKLSPYDEKEATLIFSRHNSVQTQASTATTSTHPLFMLPFTLLELNTQIKKLFPDKSSLALLASLTGCYKLVTLNSSPFSYYSSTVYGNPRCNLPIGNSPSCNQSTKDMTKTKPTLPPTGAYISMTPCPNSLKVSSYLQQTLSSTYDTHCARQHSHL